MLEKLVQGYPPIRVEKKTRDGREVAVFMPTKSGWAQESPVKYFAPLKRMAKQDLKGQNSKWLESLFWQPPDITPEAQHLPLAEAKAALCRPPYGLTESMVTLYVFALIKSGGFELALNRMLGSRSATAGPYQVIDSPRTPCPCVSGTPSSDEPLLGSRLVEWRLHKGWNEVLPWKTRYVHAYRRAHRTHYEAVADLARKLETLTSQSTCSVTG